jgi:signal transduction histidine kinase/DNA-binding response OmpR family regulator/methyl-accepting chemotaxis protein/CHASE3 domain sensor protein
MKMTIGRKLAAGFGLLLTMFIIVGIFVYTLNSHVVEDAIEVSQDDVPSVILSLSLLNDIKEMDTNVLKYMTGKMAAKNTFKANQQAFLKTFEELKQLETKIEEVKLMLTIENGFLDYANTVEQDIFNRYDPTIEQWANKKANLMIHQYGTKLKQHLEKTIEGMIGQFLNRQITEKALSHLKIYLLLLDKAGELEINLAEYLNGILEEKAEFVANAEAFETAFHNLQSLEQNEAVTFNQVFSLYTQFKQSAQDIFRQYNPQTKKNALTTLEQLEQNDLKQLQTILNGLAVEKKQAAITATNNIILIIQEITSTMIIVIFIAIIIGLSISIFLGRSISLPLGLIVKGSKQLVAGNISGLARTDIEHILHRQDEIGVLGQAFDEQTIYFKTVIEDIVQVSQGLADGNLRVTPQADYRGNFAQIKNALKTALINQCSVIEDIVHVSQGLAEGNLSVAPQSEYQGDFLSIKNAQQTALANQKQVIEDIVQMSQGLAEGNLRVTSQAQYRGDFVRIKEALDIALHNLRLVIEDIVQVSQGLAEGNHIQPQAEYLGDFINIKQALETATVKLAEVTAKNAEQDWLKTGQTQLNDLMSGEQDIVKLAKNVITFLTTYIEASVGLFYLLKSHSQAQNQQPGLHIIASYAYTMPENSPEEFLLGEGLVGQVALEKKPLLRTHTPEEYSTIIQSGLSKAVPRHVLFIPCLYENQIKGVIEIGFSKAITDNQRIFLEQVTSSIGIVVNTAQSRTKMQALLEQSQRQTEELQQQSEELQSQQEELQQINEELQNQREELEHKQVELQHHNEELQTQSEELQTQQEELKQSNETLEERTRELEQQKAEIQHKNAALEQTQAEMKKTQMALETKANELELASRYKSEFLANMSHELRTPLNSLLILAQLLTDNKNGNLTDKQIEYAQTIHSAGSDLLTLINEILDLSKVEAGKIEVHTEAISITDLVESTELKFRHVAEEKGLTFNINVTDEVPPSINSDRQRLKQILNNLLSNAFKFTQKGEVRLDINIPPHPLGEGWGEGQQIAFRITDTGIGIPKDKQQVIFEAFQQVDGSTSRRYGGTGLGLSISRQLARLLGGDMELDSEEGQGSTFTLYLPEKGLKNPPSEKKILEETTRIQAISTPQSSEAFAQQNSVTSPMKPKPIVNEIADDRHHLQSNDKTILIIEDDQKFSRLLIDLAHDKHFKCLIAEDGQTGLQLAEHYQPNAIILDVGLPLLDGWAVMEILKDTSNTRHIPVHFISATDHSMLDAKRKGAIGYLQKPVNLEQLGETFKNIEKFITKAEKNLLVVVENELHQQKIIDLVAGEDIQTTLAITLDSALQHLKNGPFDCIILDMDIEQGGGSQLLEQMQELPSLCQTPIIVYAERELEPSEEALLLQCADSLPITSVQTPERLLDETTLFLHQIEAKLPQEKRQMLRMVHDKETILANKKVLVVDDDARNIFALAIVLEDRNMEVIAGNHGKEALALLEEHPDIAIILMDIMMPEMDGYEATRKIREQPRFKKLPIIALTAKAMKGDKAKCIEAGANDYLSKPVDTDKLISLMRVWLYR